MIEEYRTQIANFSTIRPQTVLEIGALDGEYARTLQSEFCIRPENVCLVEPNPDLHVDLDRKFPAAKRIYKGIASAPGNVKLNRVVSGLRGKVGSSSMRERTDGWNQNLTHQPVQIESITGENLLDELKLSIDLCIVDVEGMAYEVLESFGDRIADIKSLMVECEHSQIFRYQRLFDDVAKLLLRNKFRMMAFKYSYADQSDSIWIQERYVDLAYKHWPVPG